jgi:hypothetical protein
MDIWIIEFEPISLSADKNPVRRFIDPIASSSPIFP